MREILFRGKQKNGEWVEGQFITVMPVDMPLIYRKPKAVIFPIEAKCNWFNKYFYRSTEVIPETVGQYTGLTDKNGNKIFEGDIILWGLAPCVAKYDIENARFMFYENGKYLKNGFNKDTMEMKEVIGNIHDNPELLKGGEEE